MSDASQEKSVDEQRKEVESFAAKNGYCILWEYIDNGISGDDTPKRKAFQRMLADAQLGQPPQGQFLLLTEPSPPGCDNVGAD
jgi:DNA invertase Pin-like site-specific DNA recombinase